MRVEVKKVQELRKRTKEAVSNIAAEIAAKMIEENSRCFALAKTTTTKSSAMTSAARTEDRVALLGA